MLIYAYRLEFHSSMDKFSSFGNLSLGFSSSFRSFCTAAILKFSPIRLTKDQNLSQVVSLIPHLPY